MTKNIYNMISFKLECDLIFNNLVESTTTISTSKDLIMLKQSSSKIKTWLYEFCISK